MTEQRLFHVLLQDHFSTLEIPGGKGVIQNAASSRLFLEMSEPLAAALTNVDDEDKDDEDSPPPRPKVKTLKRRG